MEMSFFDSLKQYVGFTEASTEALRKLHPLAAPHFVAIVDDFYAAIEAHPGAGAAITGGEAQILRLKQTLVRWVDTMLRGPHDEAYFVMRARIGRVHVRIELPQSYMFTAMDRIRVHLHEVVSANMRDHPEELRQGIKALNQIMDLELAIMLETYREDLVAKNRNAERLATIGQFAASIGHELRNPLGVIESSLFLLRQHLGPQVTANAQVAKHLDRIGGEVSRSNKTIHDLLELARNRPPRRLRTPVEHLVESAIKSASLPADVNVSTSIPTDLSTEVDADQLRQVLLNLLTNAGHAMNGAGNIVISAEPVADGVRIYVRDNGPGVPADIRYRVFEALFTTKAKGSGLGLALCRRIMAAHGGTIELEPSQQGASFVLWIPAAAAASTLAPAT